MPWQMMLVGLDEGVLVGWPEFTWSRGSRSMINHLHAASVLAS